MTTETLDRAKNALWQAMHAVCGSKPVADEHNKPALLAMAHWLIDAPHPGIAPGKSLGLRGPVGTGKTDLMKALSRAMLMGGAPEGLRIVNAVRIVKEYNQTKDESGRDAGGDLVILKYADCGPLCIDDLAREDVGRHYGKEANVIGDILCLRYEKWRTDPVRYATCCTTNATNDALRERYDERALSRLDEMQVFFPVGGPDRRETSTVNVQRRLFAEPEIMPSLSVEEHAAQCARLRVVVAEAAKQLTA